MKKALVLLFVFLVITSLTVVIVATGYYGSNMEYHNEAENEEEEENGICSAPETVVYGINGDPETLKTLCFSKTVTIAGQDVYGYSESGLGDLYLFSKNGMFLGWISNPDIDPLLSPSFEHIIKNPEAGISEDEAVSIAYGFAADLCGARMYDYDLLAVSGDDYQELITLGKEYHAADFTVIGSKCNIRVLRDGTVDLCTNCEPEVIDEDALARVTLEDVDSFVRDKINEQFGDAVCKYEVWDKKVIENETGQTIIRVGVYCWFTDTPSGEIVKEFNLGGSWGLDNCYGCVFDYYVG